MCLEGFQLLIATVVNKGLLIALVQQTADSRAVSNRSCTFVKGIDLTEKLFSLRTYQKEPPPKLIWRGFDELFFLDSDFFFLMIDSGSSSSGAVFAAWEYS